MSAITELEIQPTSREALGRLVGALARDKAALGRRYGEWAVSAPTLESGVAAAAMAQDELGHARSTLPLLKQLGVETSDEDRMEVKSTIALLNEPLRDWETFIAVNLVVDGMLTSFVDASRDSAFTPLAQRARKILQEERSHQIHAAAWTRRLADDDAAGRRLVEAIYDCWSEASSWPGDDAAYAELAQAGLVAGSPRELRSATQSAIASATAHTAVGLLWS